MNGHEHKTNAKLPTQDEVAEQAYAIYLKEGKPQGHAEPNWLAAEAKLKKCLSTKGTKKTNKRA